MENIILPQKVDIQDGSHANEKIVTMEPFYYGYGTTIGNALRRVLFSSLRGAAVTGVKIKGATHEFTTLPSVKEDIVEITLNLKNLRLKCFSEEPVKLVLKANGEKVATGADIEPNSAVEIVNPDLKIATLTDKGAELEMEIFVSQGRGYVPTEGRDKAGMEVGTIAIDSIYSPVRNVGYKVDNTRVGQITNYDKLIMTIETDGTITPEEALNKSAEILIDHFKIVRDKISGAGENEEAEVSEASGETDESVPEEATVDKISEDQEAPSEESQEEPKKKKRGRPKKSEA